ncbi:protein phosphatase 2C domain-containing protein [Pseudanabaena sp. PCC 6802]|uniref:protein phosphatase 2C domain-containing protein n=1 Tax=Pseudanabaena sp. PCC 6802 TaxID=118173 RepID=UPI0004783AF1|nr:protein phosphatase 2C domain-containing protein [Pseudanabaena sp. PCC 6802]
MQALFEVASGSIAGNHHRSVGKNNQDAYFCTSTEKATIAVVCDGCGSGEHSEVGAKLGARLAVEAIVNNLCDRVDAEFWEKIKLDLLGQLRDLAKSLGGRDRNTDRVVNNYLLFTIVGAIVTPMETVTFSLGDGLIAVNGKIDPIGPFPDNAPPYLAYGLYCPDAIGFQICDRLPTEEVRSILIGTDGVEDFSAAESMNLPGKQEKVGEISQFWLEDRYFANQDAIRRKLSRMNREATKIDWQGRRSIKAVGLLPDDTTLIAIRKRKMQDKE